MLDSIWQKVGRNVALVGVMTNATARALDILAVVACNEAAAAAFTADLIPDGDVGAAHLNTAAVATSRLADEAVEALWAALK